MSYRAIIFLGLCSLCSCLKILAIVPHNGNSHKQIFFTITKELARRNHELTVLSVASAIKMPNYTDVSLVDPLEEKPVAFDLKHSTGVYGRGWFILPLIEGFSKLACEGYFASKAVKDFLRLNLTFDLILMQVFSNDCYFSFAQRFDAPIVGITSLTIMHWVNDRYGNCYNPSYIPNNAMEYSDKMTFFQRMNNFLVGIFHNAYYHQRIIQNGEEIARSYFNESVPFGDLALKSSMLVVNSHFDLNLPRPLVPAIVEVDGLHLAKNKTVDINLEKWINESTHGVIYFSLGSMIKGHTFPEEKRRQFLKAFARLPQRVLWKYENETMPEKPENLMIQKWMPQLDILCHPNVKAFISHGGLLGTTEAVHCGVPVMVMPQYGDQFTNAKALEANGGGVILHLHEATEEKVYDALTTILQPKFKKQAEELSARFKDRPMPPLETAIYWVEYVARHKGAHHMRTAAVGMPLYKYLLLDVIAFVLVLFAIAFLAFLYVARAVFRRLFQKSDSKKKTN